MAVRPDPVAVPDGRHKRHRAPERTQVGVLAPQRDDLSLPGLSIVNVPRMWNDRKAVEQWPRTAFTIAHVDAGPSVTAAPLPFVSGAETVRPGTVATAP